MDKRELTEIIASGTCLNLAKLRTPFALHKRRDQHATPLDCWFFADALAERLQHFYKLERKAPAPPHSAGPGSEAGAGPPRERG